jgi:hypothetical protein
VKRQKKRQMEDKKIKKRQQKVREKKYFDWSKKKEVNN